MTVALVALFVALTGTAAAGTGLINGAQIKPHTLNANALTAAALKTLRGNVGPQGRAGGFDPAKVSYVSGDMATVVPGQTWFSFAECPAGTKVVGGGGYASVATLVESSPSIEAPNTGTSNGWTIVVRNDTSITTNNVQAYAVCVAP